MGRAMFRFDGDPVTVAELLAALGVYVPDSSPSTLNSCLKSYFDPKDETDVEPNAHLRCDSH
jgi:hypothetical protein